MLKRKKSGTKKYEDDKINSDLKISCIKNPIINAYN